MSISKIFWRFKLTALSAVILSASATNLLADDELEQVIKVDINLHMKHEVGGNSIFERRKWINVHAASFENDWTDLNDQSRGALNADPNFMTNFLEGYDVYMGRDTGLMRFQLGLLPQDPNRMGWVNGAAAINNGNGFRFNYTSTNGFRDRFKLARQHEHRATDAIVAAQQHPYWPNGDPISAAQQWSFSQADTPAEPFGTATGNYLANFLFGFFNRGGGDTFGASKPTYLEVMNEPLFDLVDFPKPGSTPVTPLQVFNFHNAVANEVRAYTPPAGGKPHKDMKIGGYTVAFPDFDREGKLLVESFGRWEERDKLFIDTAGANMDFFSVHLYDFPTFPVGPEVYRRLRRGSNVEATLDMMEQYSLLALGERKPFVISEFGASVHTLRPLPWQPLRDAHKLAGMNGLMMSFLERPDQIVKAIPFIPIKAEWGRFRNSSNVTTPYSNRLLRQKCEADMSLPPPCDTAPGLPASEKAWVYTDLVKFYELWSDVKGIRVDSWASDLDIQANAYVDGNTATIILNSLEFSEAEIDLRLLGAEGKTISEIFVKEYYIDSSNLPQLDEKTYYQMPEAITLNPEATMVMHIHYVDDISISTTNNEVKYYADTYKQPITAGSTISFNIDGVALGSHGEAILRLGLGRAHDKSLKPKVRFNGKTIKVPTDYRGYDQYDGGLGRPEFFGVIEVPVKHKLLQETNTVELEFSDDGGFVTTATLQVFNTEDKLKRGQR
ncbi:MAG: agarase [Gammaproteobacteria bacterium]|nr:agarase [Gammaproteobacteria bacterium]